MTTFLTEIHDYQIISNVNVGVGSEVAEDFKQLDLGKIKFTFARTATALLRAFLKA
jgi:hypothetical protein